MYNSEISERKKQETCPGCGEPIKDHNKECPNCGEFPEKAYHDKGTEKVAGLSKQIASNHPNQKIIEGEGQGLRNIKRYEDF
jgi:primosomal protein N'